MGKFTVGIVREIQKAAIATVNIAAPMHVLRGSAPPISLGFKGNRVKPVVC